MILDFLQYTMPTRDFNMFPMLRRFTERRPPNIQMIILVVQDNFAYSLLNLVKRVIPKTHIIFGARSLDDALAMIAKRTEPQ